MLKGMLDMLDMLDVLLDMLQTCHHCILLRTMTGLWVSLGGTSRLAAPHPACRVGLVA